MPYPVGNLLSYFALCLTLQRTSHFFLKNSPFPLPAWPSPSSTVSLFLPGLLCFLLRHLTCLGFFSGLECWSALQFSSAILSAYLHTSCVVLTHPCFCPLFDRTVLKLPQLQQAQRGAFIGPALTLHPLFPCIPSFFVGPFYQDPKPGSFLVLPLLCPQAFHIKLVPGAFRLFSLNILISPFIAKDFDDVFYKLLQLPVF